MIKNIIIVSIILISLPVLAQEQKDEFSLFGLDTQLRFSAAYLYCTGSELVYMPEEDDTIRTYDENQNAFEIRINEFSKEYDTGDAVQLKTGIGTSFDFTLLKRPVRLLGVGLYASYLGKTGGQYPFHSVGGGISLDVLFLRTELGLSKPFFREKPEKIESFSYQDGEIIPEFTNEYPMYNIDFSYYIEYGILRIGNVVPFTGSMVTISVFDDSYMQMLNSSYIMFGVNMYL